MKIQITPITKQLNYLEIISVNVNLDSSARITAYVSNNENLGQSYSLFMDNETYSNWSNDDQFVMNWVCEQLGVQPA